MEGTRRPSDTPSSGSGGKAANPALLCVGASETRRPSLTPDMLNFDTMNKKINAIASMWHKSLLQISNLKRSLK